MSGKQPDLHYVPAEPIPFWQVLHNGLTDDLKNERYIKNIYKHTIKEINEIIESGKMWCDDCGEQFELKIPQNYKELRDFACHIINDSVVRPCDNCMRKSIENGSIIGSVEGGWYPDKETLLKEFEDKK